MLGPSNTHASFSVERRESIPGTRNYSRKGSSGNLPAGEVLVVPVEEMANGIIDNKLESVLEGAELKGAFKTVQ